MSERRPELSLRRLSLMLTERNRRRKDNKSRKTGSKPQLKEKEKDSSSLSVRELGLKLNKKEPDLRLNTKNERGIEVN